MGIDTFASRSPDDILLTDEDRRAFSKAKIQLCGGIFSGDGSDGSFRGKVYAITIMDITGQSLVQEWIPPETVCEMYDSFQVYCQDEGCEDISENDPEYFSILELQKFLKVCSERGLGLINWG